MKIGNINLKHGIMLAPMAGYSDRAMRVVCHKYGSEYSVSEMVSATALYYGDRKTLSLMTLSEDEGPSAVQIFGKEPEIMAYAAEKISGGIAGGVMPVAIDINMGCPVKKIYSNGEGSALMHSPLLIEKIVRAVKGSTHLPVTVKLRTGVDSKHINVLECALRAEEGGASLITVHGRTREQMYSGQIDKESIKKVKAAVKIPVIANGDITTAKGALELLSYTGADGVMIGRGAVGNPFIFSEINALVEGREYEEPTLNKRIEVALLQLRIAIEEKGEARAVCEARKQIALYLHGFRGSAKLRADINKAETYEEVLLAINALRD